MQPVEHESLRVPPHSITAESSLLGALLLSNDAGTHIHGIVQARDFYRYEHKTIFQAIQTLIDQDKPADVITVHDWLESKGLAEGSGGLPYLNTLAQYVPSAANITRYAEIVKEKAVLRNLIAAGDEIVRDAFAPSGKSVSDQLDLAEEKILAIGASDNPRHEGQSLSTLIPKFNELLLERSENPGKLLGRSTGYTDLDRQTNGLRDGDLIVLAARPSMGKTSLAMNIAEHVAIQERLPVAVFSLEMSADQLTTKLVGSLGRIDQSNLATGRLADHEWGRVAEAMDTLHQAPIEIHDSGVHTMGAIRSMARRALHRYKRLGLIVVDYLQLIEGGDGGPDENRATEVGNISRGLKLLAKELGCPVIALSQLNRKLESRTDKRPIMSDLRDSGSIEQDADVIAFIYRDDYYTKEKSLTPGIAEVILAKQRNGPTGTVNLAWQASYTRFSNMGV